MTKQVFAKACMILQSLPSQVKWDDAVQATYLLGMHDWSDDVVGAVIMHVLKNCEFRPTVAEIRKIGIKLFDPKLSPEAIYEQVRKVLIEVSPADRKRHVGTLIANGRMRPEVQKVADECGGWARLSTMDASDVRAKVQSALVVVYESTNFDHVFVRPEGSPALDRGRKALEALAE